MKPLQNQKGSVLVYVLMISAVLMIIVPTLYMASFAGSSSNNQTEGQKIVTQLTVSGMQTILRYSSTPSVQYAYLRDNHYDTTNLTFPNGQSITYRQYVAAQKNDDVSVNTDTFDPNSGYYIVVEATLGNHRNRITRYFPAIAPTPPVSPTASITSVSSQPTINRVGTVQMVAVSVDTTNINNNTPVSVELTKLDGSSLSPVVQAADTISNNHSVVSLLVPRNVPAGSYKFKVTISTLTNNSTGYDVSTTAPASNQVIIVYNGVVQTMTATEFATLQTINTPGTFFAPAGLADYTLFNPISITANKGIFIDGTALFTLTPSSPVTLRACEGPVTISGAFPTSLTSNITIQAGTDILANSSTISTATGTIKLTANGLIDLTNANLFAPTINLSAFNNTSKIQTTGTNFHGTTPTKTANNGTAVTCP